MPTVAVHGGPLECTNLYNKSEVIGHRPIKLKLGRDQETHVTMGEAIWLLADLARAVDICRRERLTDYIPIDQVDRTNERFANPTR
jgi:hypothetical protein